jgi:hypothetical protein
MKSNINSEPSLTTDENKIYLSGGTTADSKIVVRKPTPNYFAYGIIALIGLLVVRRVFFKK